MEQQFRSAVSWVLMGSMVTLFTVLGYMSVRDAVWPVLLLLLGTLAFVAYTLFGTVYTIRGMQLHVRSGFFKMAPIEITSMQRIRRSNNPVSAPAASFRRLEIKYGKGKYVLVSPKDEAAFIQALQAVHPEIEVVL